MKKGRMGICIVLLVCIVAAAGGLLFLGVIRVRMRGGTYIKAAEEDTRLGRVVCYRQDDAEWEEDALGDSSYTMKSSGCLVSCIATALSTSGDDITPGELNALFSQNDVYDEDGNIQWKNIEKIDGYAVKVYDNVSKSDINQCLEEGHYPIVRVRRHGWGSYHYVLIAGAKDKEYICMDPLSDRLLKLSDYKGMVYAVRCVWRKKSES